MVPLRRRTAVAVFAALVVAVAAAPANADEGGSFAVRFDPPLSQDAAQGNPDSPGTPVTVTVQARGPDGAPLRDAVIDLRMTAPRPSALAGSDVPRVEGRQLLHTRFGAPSGEYSFRYVFPIRGDYQLALRALPASGARPGFTPFSSTQAFHIEERSGELLKLIAVGVGLALFGALSTIVLARSQLAARASGRASPDLPRSRAPMVAGGVLAVLLGAFAAFLVVEQVKDARTDHRVGGYQGAAVGETHTARSGPVALRVHSDRSSRDGIGVQTIVRTRGTVTDARTGAPLDGARVQIATVDLESGSPSFSTTAPAPDGRFVWEHTYWDGVDYDAKVSATTPSGDATVARAAATIPVSVEPMSPPVGRKLLGLLYLLLPLLAGIALGLVISFRRWGPRHQLTPSRAATASG